MKKIISLCKNGVRYDFPIEKGGPGSGRKPNEVADRAALSSNQKKHYDSLREEGISHNSAWRMAQKETEQSSWREDIDRFRAEKLSKQEPIASDEPIISEGAIVSMNGHTGKVLDVTGDIASVSWEDASISEVDIDELEYEGRVEKGGPGSGRYSDDATGVKLQVARHLRRQGMLPKRKISKGKK